MDAQDTVADTSPANPVKLRVTDDKMHILLTVIPPIPATPQLLDAVESALADLPFAQPIIRSAWASRVTQAVVVQELNDVPIVEGTPPIPPTHGRVEWVADFFSTGFVIDETTGRADYRQRSAQQSVEAGQLLARIIPPEEGKDGSDVFGHKVAAEKARPAKVRAGQNVRYDEAAGMVHSEATGRIRFKDGLVTVDEVFTIEGSVDLETGNIRHPGALVVHGDIEADTSVETTGHIEVTGIIEPSNVSTGGDLVVHGGITGGEGKRIVAANIRAKFILDADIECSGNVIVDTEIVQSNITARGAVSCPRGRIVGGRIVAQGGIEAGQIGSELGVRTMLSAGDDLSIAAKLAECDASLSEWKQQRDQIATKIAPLKARIERLDEHIRAAVEQLEAQIGQIDTEMSALQAQKRQLREQSAASCRPQLFVYGRAHSECFMALAGERTRITDTLDGPMCFENVDDGIRTRIVQGNQRGSNLLDGDSAKRDHALASR